MSERENKKPFDELEVSIPNSRIVITGSVSNHDLPSYYSVMDVFVHPSLQDELPSLGYLKPVIITPVGGMLDIVNDCENGRIVTVNKISSLTRIIQEVLSDKSLQKHLGRSARQTVQSRFALEQELDGNLELYRKLLKI